MPISNVIICNKDSSSNDMKLTSISEMTALLFRIFRDWFAIFLVCQLAVYLPPFVNKAHYNYTGIGLISNYCTSCYAFKCSTKAQDLRNVWKNAKNLATQCSRHMNQNEIKWNNYSLHTWLSIQGWIPEISTQMELIPYNF